MKKITPRLTSIILGTCILFSVTVPAFALTWVDQSPGTAAVDIYYDFRPSILGQPNSIAPWQINSTMAAMQLWSSVSNLNFIWKSMGAGQSDHQYRCLTYRWAMEHSRSGWVQLYERGRLLAHRRRHRRYGLERKLGFRHWQRQPRGTIDFFTVATHEIVMRWCRP